MKKMDAATQAGAAAIGSVMSLGLDPGSDAAHRHVDALLPGMLRHFPPGYRQQPTRSPVAIRCLTRTARTSWR